VTLIEILIVSVVIGIMATLAFPAFKIMQQREKEKRLKRVLTEIRTAIAGGKSQQSGQLFVDGYRNYVRAIGIEQIMNKHGNDPVLAAPEIASFVYNLTSTGLGYPQTPSSLTESSFDFSVPTLESENVQIKFARRFLRRLPPHPFTGWYPNAHWEFKPASANLPLPEGTTTFKADAEAWTEADPTELKITGVLDIRSVGAGLALDGSNTDDW
jgi:type II secretory pathway pseudopilin PulG